MRVVMMVAVFLSLFLLGVGVSFAIDANQLFYLNLYPNATTTGTTTNSAVTGFDVHTYKGNATVLFAMGAGTDVSVTGTVTMLTCATSNGVYAVVTNAAGSAVKATHVGTAAAALEEVAIDLTRVLKFLRVKVENGTDTNAVSVVLCAPMKSE
jgi:hypothetical protein